MYGQRAKKIKNIISLNRDVQGTSDLQQLYSEIDELKKRLMDRTKEFEMIKAVGVNTLEQNKLLKEKLDVLNKVNEEEIQNLEAQLEDVVHHQKTELYQVKLECMNLQSNLDVERKQQLELKLKLLREKDEREDLQGALHNSKEELAKVKEELTASNQEKAELEEQVKALTDKEKSLSSQLASLQNKYQEKEKEYTAANKKIAEQASSRAELEEEYQASKRKAEALSKEISSLKVSGAKTSTEASKITELEESLESTRKELQDKTKELKKITKQRDELQTKLENAEATAKSLKSELREAKQLNVTYEAKIKSLQDALDVERALSKVPADIIAAPVQEAPRPTSKGSKRKEIQPEEEEAEDKTAKKKRRKSPEAEKKADKADKSKAKEKATEKPEKKSRKKKTNEDEDMEVEELPNTKLIEKPAEPAPQKRRLFNIDEARNPLSPVENKISQPKQPAKPKTLHSLFQFGGFKIPKLKNGPETANKENE